MTTDKQPIDIHESKSMPFGKRLQSAREAMQLERKDVATQLRLNERVIFMMEKNRYAADIPVMFIRGYLRSYAKFLAIPDYETNKAIEHIKAKPASQLPSLPHTKPLLIGQKSSHYFMHIFTFLIIVTLVGLIGSWWYTQNQPAALDIASNKPHNVTNTLIAPLAIETKNTVNTVTSTENGKEMQPAEPIAVTNKVMASKQSKPTVQSDDYDDDED